MRPGRGGGVAVKLMAGVVSGGGGPPSLWRTPTPYLFLGFTLIMGVIAVALLVLVCTRKKPSSSSSDDDDKPASAEVLAPLDREPKVMVVIMAGDRAPFFLASAKPLASGAAGMAAAV